MVKRYITQGNLLMEVNRADGGCWVNLVAPTLEECVQIAQEFQIDLADVRAALDDEESSRVDVSNEYSLILFDVPSVEYRHQREAYTTIPLGLILVNDVLLTVCAEATPVLKNFLENTVKEFSTKKQMRFIYQIFLRSCMLYQSYLRIIDRKRKEIEAHIGDDTEEMELIDLHELESNLVYFDTSLRANKVVLDRLMRYSRIKKYPEDQDLLDDVVVENQQAIEMTRIYRLISAIPSFSLGIFFVIRISPAAVNLIGSFFIWIFLPISIQSPILCFAFPLSDIIPYRAVLSHFFF